MDTGNNNIFRIQSHISYNQTWRECDVNIIWQNYTVCFDRTYGAIVWIMVCIFTCEANLSLMTPLLYPRMEIHLLLCIMTSLIRLIIYKCVHLSVWLFFWGCSYIHSHCCYHSSNKRWRDCRFLKSMTQSLMAGYAIFATRIIVGFGNLYLNYYTN